MTRQSPARWAVVVAALVLCVGAGLLHLGSRLRAAEERVRLAEKAAEVARSTERQLQEPLQAAEREAGRAVRNSAELTSTAVESLRRVLARESARPPRVTGPFRTLDNRWALVLPDRRPAGPRSGAGGEGASGLVVLVETLLAGTDLPRLPQLGFEYELSAVDPATGQRLTFARSAASELVAPATARLRVLDSDWILAVGTGTASAGWRRADWVAAIIVVLLALAAGLLALDVSSRTEHLREELEHGRRRIGEVYDRLMEESQQRADIEQQFAHASYHDAITGLPNRRYFMNRVNRALLRLRRQPGASLAILVLGLDRFKGVNETYGYVTGDELLRQAGRRLQECIQPSDLALSRIGGDEFAVLIQDLPGVDTATTLATQCQDALARPFEIEREIIFAGASVGITVRASGYADADEVVREADIALSRAKAEGRAGHALFDARAREEVVSLQQLETDLHLAIEGDQLQVHFQPIVSLTTGRVAGMEALVRWDHPRQGLVQPGQFIRAAEALGLIVPINRWVLKRVAAQAREWIRRLPAPADFYVSANLSGHDLGESDLIDFVERLVREHELPQGVLRLEVTESVLIDDVRGASDLIAGLRRIGVPLLLDDFGTGYSSLSYLDRFRTDYLKIDRTFIRRGTPDGPDSRVLPAIIHLARDLGMGTIAEGVETEEDLTLLMRLQCDYAQGYYFSRPVPAGKAEAMLRVGGFDLPGAQGVGARVGSGRTTAASRAAVPTAAARR